MAISFLSEIDKFAFFELLALSMNVFMQQINKLQTYLGLRRLKIQEHENHRPPHRILMDNPLLSIKISMHFAHYYNGIFVCNGFYVTTQGIFICTRVIMY